VFIVEHRARSAIVQLSGGEQQQVAIVRALAVVRILNWMAQQYQIAIIVVTHDEKIIPTFQRFYHIRDGRAHEEAGEGRPAWGALLMIKNPSKFD